MCYHTLTSWCVTATFADFLFIYFLFHHFFAFFFLSWWMYPFTLFIRHKSLEEENVAAYLTIFKRTKRKSHIKHFYFWMIQFVTLNLTTCGCVFLKNNNVYSVLCGLEPAYSKLHTSLYKITQILSFVITWLRNTFLHCISQ